jgi:hypothetical protein
LHRGEISHDNWQPFSGAQSVATSSVSLAREFGLAAQALHNSSSFPPTTTS